MNNDHDSVETRHIQSSDFIEKENDEKTNENSLQIDIKDVVTTNINQPTDFFEDNEKDKESILAQKNNESFKSPSPDNMVSSNISSVLYFDTLENNSDNDNASYKVDHKGRYEMNNDHISVKTSHAQSSNFIEKENDEKTNKKSLSSDNMVSGNISSILYFDTLENNSDNDNASYKVDHEGRSAIEAVIIQPDLPPLSEYDLESESEDE